MQPLADTRVRVRGHEAALAGRTAQAVAGPATRVPPGRTPGGPRRRRPVTPKGPGHRRSSPPDRPVQVTAIVAFRNFRFGYCKRYRLLRP